MKIRDLLVIGFTAIVAMVLLCRDSRPSGRRLVYGVGGGCHELRCGDGEGGQEGAAGVGRPRRALR